MSDVQQQKALGFGTLLAGPTHHRVKIPALFGSALTPFYRGTGLSDWRYK